MLPVVSIVLLTLGGVLASPIANKYVDDLLECILRSELNELELDPAHVSNFSTEFTDKFLGMKVKGKANYTDGTLVGLSKVVRSSECFGPSNAFGVIKINCTIELNNLQFHYNGKLKYGKLPAVPIKANANVTTTILFVEFARQPEYDVGDLADMQYELIGKIKPKFTGLGRRMKKYMKFLEVGYKAHAKAELMDIITDTFYASLDMAVSQLPMPS